MATGKKDYVSIIYDEGEKPLTRYPEKLARYLVGRFDLKKNNTLLEIGCGRGEFLKGFISCGLKGFGVDQSDAARALCPDAEIKTCDLESNFPYEDNSFDIVYSKSFVEHFYYPEKIFSEIYRILKPGGLVITLTPDWEEVYKIFYEDYTHRTPFTLTSLKDIQRITGFENVRVERFRQLPFLWRLPWLEFICILTSRIVPNAFRTTNKFIHFSKDVMLLGAGHKPMAP